MVIKTQPELPKYAQQPMPIGEKINLKFEVSCGRPLTYEWLKQGLREDVTSSASSASSSRSALTPVSNGRELVGEVVEGGEGSGLEPLDGLVLLKVGRYYVVGR